MRKNVPSNPFFAFDGGFIDIRGVTAVIVTPVDGTIAKGRILIKRDRGDEVVILFESYGDAEKLAADILAWIDLGF